MKKRPWPGWLWRHDLGVPAPLLIGLFALPLLFAAVFLMDDILDALLSAFVLGPVWVLGSTLAISMSTQAPSTSRARCIVRSLVVTAIVPLSFTPALLPFILPRAAFDDARTLRFIVVKPWYDAQIAKLPRNQKPHIVVFVWGGFAPSGFWGAAYDDSDEVMLPPARRSARWKKVAAATEFSCGFGVRPLWDHYYLYSSPCE